jgi:hypothetical protein
VPWVDAHDWLAQENAPWRPPKATPRTRRRGKGPGNGRGHLPTLTREQAIAALRMAAEIGSEATGAKFGVAGGSTLPRTWHHYGLVPPGRRVRPPLLTRAQAIEVGTAAAAAEYGVHEITLRTTWKRYGIPQDRRGQLPRRVTRADLSQRARRGWETRKAKQKAETPA